MFDTSDIEGIKERTIEVYPTITKVIDCNKNGTKIITYFWQSAEIAINEAKEAKEAGWIK